jgi:Domain of unknown function (DUF3395)
MIHPGSTLIPRLARPTWDQILYNLSPRSRFALDWRVQAYSALCEEDRVNPKTCRQLLRWGTLAVLLASFALAASAQNNWGNTNSSPYQNRLRGDDQKRFDDYYSKWLRARERKDTGEIASMEARMLDVYSHNNIQSNVPYDLVASPNVALPTTGYDNWRGRLRGEDQQRFDSYYTRWLEYRAKKDKEQIASMQGRMLDVYAHNNIPLTTPYEFIASSNVVPNVGYYSDNQNYNRHHHNDNGYNNGNANGYGNGSLRILQAFYGVPGKQADVAGRLQGMVSSDGLRLRVNNDSMGGDPAPNTHKQLYVVYSYQGQQRSVTVDESNDLRIP